MELNKTILEFILPKVNQENYTHRTYSKEIADQIIKEGFQFTNSFQKTTDQIIDDMVYIKYWDTLRKHYGTFVIIISMSSDIIKTIQSKLNPSFEAQQVMGKIILQSNFEDQDMYVLPKEYVKGYIKRENGEIAMNPNFNPEFVSSTIEANINFFNQ